MTQVGGTPVGCTNSAPHVGSADAQSTTGLCRDRGAGAGTARRCAITPLSQIKSATPRQIAGPAIARLPDLFQNTAEQHPERLYACHFKPVDLKQLQRSSYS